MSLDRRYEITRLEAFSDAVFAFALTLLVVSLEVPKTFDEMIALLSGFLPFACCFALLIWIWYEHSAFFSRYGLHDPLTTTLNAVLLFVVLFYVYPLKYLFTATFSGVLPQLKGPGAPPTLHEIVVLFVVYGCGFMAVFSVFALLYYRAWRLRSQLGLTPLEVRDTRGAIGSHLVSVGVGFLSVAWALLMPGTIKSMAGFVYFLMGPGHWAYGELNARRRREFLKAAQAAG